jgi:hypothetical protein
VCALVLLRAADPLLVFMRRGPRFFSRGGQPLVCTFLVCRDDRRRVIASENDGLQGDAHSV